METQPAVFYKAAHYEGYDAVLIRLPLIEEGQLGELLEQCWQRRATKSISRERIR